MKKTIFLILLTLILSASFCFASESFPKQMVWGYVPDLLYKLNIQVKEPVEILLPVGEKVAFWTIGDHESFEPFKYEGKEYIKAIKPNADSSFLIKAESGNFYLFYLRGFASPQNPMLGRKVKIIAQPSECGLAIEDWSKGVSLLWEQRNTYQEGELDKRAKRLCFDSMDAFLKVTK